MPAIVVAAVLLSALLHAGWNALLRQSKDRNWTASWIGVTTFFTCAPFLFWVGFPSRSWPCILISASLHVVYLGLLARAYRLNELSFAYPIARGASPLLVSLGGLVVASEVPRMVQGIGILAIVAGIAAIGLESKHWDPLGFQIALATGCVIACYTVIDGLGARLEHNSMKYNVWCFSTYGSWVLMLNLGRGGLKAFKGPRKQLVLAVGGGVTSVIAYVIVTWAMVRSPMGSVSALRESSALFATLIGVLLMKERFSHQKLFGCAAIACGAVLIGIS